MDDQIIAAVERILASNGSPIDITKVTQIRIYKVDTSNTNGNEVAGSANRWIYGAGQGPVVGGQALDFKKDMAVQGWAACSRVNGANADSIFKRKWEAILTQLLINTFPIPRAGGARDWPAAHPYTRRLVAAITPRSLNGRYFWNRMLPAQPSLAM